MQTDPVVAANLKVEEARRAYYAADDVHDWPECTRLGKRLTSLEYAEHYTAPTSNVGAARKLINIVLLHDLNPWSGSRAIGRSAKRLAEKVGRGDITPLTLRAMRALIPACQRYDAKACTYDATGHALMNAIDWCAGPKLV